MSATEEGVVLKLKKYTSDNMFENPTNQRIIFVNKTKGDKLFDHILEILKAQTIQHQQIPRKQSFSYLQQLPENGSEDIFDVQSAEIV